MVHDDLSSYMGIFLDEVEEQLQVLDEKILRLEQGNFGTNVIDDIFRAAHTLKGSSAAMNFSRMESVTHRMESLLEPVRQQQIQVDRELVNILFACVDFIKTVRWEITEQGREITEPDELFDRLQTFQQYQEPSGYHEKEGEALQSLESDDEVYGKLDIYQQDLIYNALLTGNKALAVTVCLQEQSLMKSVRALLVHNRLKDAGEIIASFPPIAEIEQERFSGKFIYVLLTQSSSQDIKSMLKAISELEWFNIDEISEQRLSLAMPAETSKVVSEIHQNPAEPVKYANHKKVGQAVRVDVERIDHLMNLIGELVIDQTRLRDACQKLNLDRSGNDSLDDLNEIAGHLGSVIGELQEGMMKVRMLPIEQLFNRFPRMVRDVAYKSGKDVNFTMEGKETELDRTLIEEISDPIIHLLRNAVDHGIEAPEERELVGKPGKGALKLRAAHRENVIVITVEDDGRGIDPHKIRASALRKGIITEEGAALMNDKQLMSLIFKPGFSTAQAVTDISGRGVGMDIVRSHIESLNGMIEIESTVGQGTKFTIKLPLTLAIIRSLLIRMSDRIFAVPMVNVSEIMRLSRKEIVTVQNREVAYIRGRILPLERLHERLEIPVMHSEEQHLYVVEINAADKRLGLVVDQLLGNQEIVVKNLGQFIGTPPFIAGATIMGNGDVGLILDAVQIVEQFGGAVTEERFEMSQVHRAVDEIQLVTFQWGNEEYGVHIHALQDIIKVPEIAQVAVTKSSDVIGLINHRGRLIPVMDLRNKLRLDSQSFTGESRIMIIECRNRLIGIVVDRVTQVVKLDTGMIQLSPHQASMEIEEKFIRGICYHEQRLLIMLDLEQVIQDEQLIAI